MKLTIFFDGQYWIGIIEKIDNQNLFAYKHLFGAKPTNSEVLNFVNKTLIRLLKTKKSSVNLTKEITISSNPKKRAREANKEVQKKSISTYAQQALKLEQENKKIERKVTNKSKKQELENIKFEMKQNKKKEKHKGR